MEASAMNDMVQAQAQAATTPSPSLGRPRITTSVWLVLWAALLLWASHALATAWPYVGLMPQWLLLLAVPGMLFRSFDLILLQAAKRRLGGWRRLLLRLAALVVGIPVALTAWDALDGVSMHRFEIAMSPLVADLHAKPPTSCPPESGYPLGPDVQAYLDSASAPRATAELHFAANRFVLAFPGRSMDIDGSTMFYDSIARAWRKAHNDTLARTGELTTLVRDLAACRIRLP